MQEKRRKVTRGAQMSGDEVRGLSTRLFPGSVPVGAFRPLTSRQCPSRGSLLTPTPAHTGTARYVRKRQREKEWKQRCSSEAPPLPLFLMPPHPLCSRDPLAYVPLLPRRAERNTDRGKRNMDRGERNTDRGPLTTGPGQWNTVRGQWNTSCDPLPPVRVPLSPVRVPLPSVRGPLSPKGAPSSVSAIQSPKPNRLPLPPTPTAHIKGHGGRGDQLNDFERQRK